MKSVNKHVSAKYHLNPVFPSLCVGHWNTRKGSGKKRGKKKEKRLQPLKGIPSEDGMPQHGTDLQRDSEGGNSCLSPDEYNNGYWHLKNVYVLCNNKIYILIGKSGNYYILHIRFYNTFTWYLYINLNLIF